MHDDDGERLSVLAAVRALSCWISEIPHLPLTEEGAEEQGGSKSDLPVSDFTYQCCEAKWEHS